MQKILLEEEDVLETERDGSDVGKRLSTGLGATAWCLLANQILELFGTSMKKICDLLLTILFLIIVRS